MIILKKIKFFGLILSVVVLFTSMISINAFASNEKDNSIKQERIKVEKLVIESEIQARKATIEELTKKYYPDSKDKVYNKTQSDEFKKLFDKKVKKLLSKHNIKIVSDGNTTEDDLSIQSVSPPKDKVDLRDPVIYTSSQGYFIKSSVYWKRKDTGTPYWYDHAPCCGLGTLNVGGADGLGMYFNNTTNLSINDTSFYTYDEDLNTYNNNLYPYRVNNAGAYYKAQDTIQNASWKPYYHYSWDSAHLTVWPNFSGPVNAQVRTHWTHTWSDADITGVSVSTSGIGVTIANTDKAWDGVSQGYATISVN
jgi:hypothetical protein